MLGRCALCATVGCWWGLVVMSVGWAFLRRVRMVCTSRAGLSSLPARPPPWSALPAPETSASPTSAARAPASALAFPRPAQSLWTVLCLHLSPSPRHSRCGLCPTLRAILCALCVHPCSLLSCPRCSFCTARMGTGSRCTGWVGGRGASARSPPPAAVLAHLPSSLPSTSSATSAMLTSTFTALSPSPVIAASPAPPPPSPAPTATSTTPAAPDLAPTLGVRVPASCVVVSGALLEHACPLSFFFP